ncbi:MAG TPA: Asp-tRNA(Asn)/Glu-tRNA(Gln) amidotransferase subunit GatC [Actinomycetota bacterium]|nr:Asp-tRNA(Asn)/Glu-tRNA(Gln) amidotransferase subunit GatC [Actinomycetota bacterium]
MAITRDQVAHVARLARLSFTDEDLDKFAQQLSKILDYAEQVSALTTEDVPPTSHALPLRNVLRADVARDCLPQEKALSTAPAVEQGRFMVPRIMEEQ